MAFCTKCGNQVNEGQGFCTKCGNKIGAGANPTPESTYTAAVAQKPSRKFSDILKGIFPLLEFRSNRLLMVAFALFIAFFSGEAIINILTYGKSESYLLFSDYNLETLFKNGVYLVLFGLIFLIGKLFRKLICKINKKLIAGLFIGAFSLLVIYKAMITFSIYLIKGSFLTYMNYALMLIMPILTALYVFVVKPKTPILPFISYFLITFYTSNFYFDKAFAICLALFYPIAFFIYWIVPKKEKLIVSLIGVALIAWDLIEDIIWISQFYFSVSTLLNFVETSVEVILCLSLIFCFVKKQRKTESQEEIKKREKVYSNKLIIIPIVTAVVLFIGYSITASVITVNYINNNIIDWRIKFFNANIEDWDEYRQEVTKYSPTDMAKSFIPRYDEYSMITANLYAAERISKCYDTYNSSYAALDDDFYSEFESIYVPDYWKDDSLMRRYYEKYNSMKPSIDKVTVSRTYSAGFNRNEVTVTVKNENRMAVKNCKVAIKITGLYIKPGYYSSNDYERGTEYITIAEIPGNSTVTETLSIDLDEYYDSYSSYTAAIIWECSVELLSIGAE